MKEVGIDEHLLKLQRCNLTWEASHQACHLPWSEGVSRCSHSATFGFAIVLLETADRVGCAADVEVRVSDS